MSSATPDVLIIGAGPVGLALGVALRTHGVDTVIVEREPGTKHEPRASILWQRSLEVLRDLGCADAFMECGQSIARSEFHVAGRMAGVQHLSVPDTAFPHPLGIEQDAIERLLHARLKELGPDVWWSTEATAVRAEKDGVAVELRGPDGRTRTMDTGWVVGCEGAHSLVRKTLGIAFEGEQRTNLQCVQINAKAGWPLPDYRDVSRIFVNHGVSLIASPVPGGATRFFAFSPDPDPAIQQPPDVAEMERLVAAASGRESVTLTPTSPHWANRARFHDRIAATLRHGRLILAGDSAHLWAPIGGRGLNTGLRSVHNLGWKLASVVTGRAPEALLDTYDTEVRASAQTVMRNMRRNVIEIPPNRRTLTALSLLLPLALRADRRTRRGALFLSDFAAGHSGSALSAGKQAGSRLPDLEATTADGRPVRLHSLLSYQRWTLLVEAAANLRLQTLAEQHGMHLATVRLPSRRSPGVMLVRPDGHVGMCARLEDLRELEGYVERWFAPGLPGS